MDYCKSDANTSADKPAQLEFLKAHPVLPLELEPDDVVLDHSVEYMDGEESRWVWVRYFAGPERRYSNIQSSDSPLPCMFSLVTATNRTEDKAAMVRYTTSEGVPLELPEGRYCIGSAPPKIEEHEDGPTTVTLRCDQVVQR